MNLSIFDEHNVSPVMLTVFGSHLYGLSTESSDTDYKGIYVPSKRSWILNEYVGNISRTTGEKHQKNSNEDIDVGLYSIQKFIQDSLKGETHAIDMLHANNPVYSVDIWEYILTNRTKFYSKDMKSFIGYAAKQAHKYGVKGSRLKDMEVLMNILSGFSEGQRLESFMNPISEAVMSGELEHTTIDWNKGDHGATVHTIGKKFGETTPVVQVMISLEKTYETYGHRAQLAKENKGVDFKAVSHAIRAACQQKAIFLDGDFDYPLKETDFIFKVKKGELDFITEVQPVLEELIQEVKELSNTSNLPSKPNKGFWDNFLIDIFMDIPY